MTVNERIARLERHSRRMQAAWITLLLVLAGLALLGARGQQEPPEKLVAREFVLVDGSDEVRARLRQSRTSVSLVLYDEKGTSRAILRHSRFGGTELCLLDASGTARERLAVARRQAPEAGSGTNTFAERERALLQRLAEKADDIDARIRLGNLYYDTDRPHRAIPLYQEVLRQRPDDDDVRVDLATCFLRTAQPAKAREILETVIKRRPNKPQALHNLAAVLEMQGEWERAARLWERAAAVMSDESLAAECRKRAREAREKAEKEK